MAKFFITTAIPYVNAKPHIGHALEFVQADAIARFHKLLGDDVLLLSGGDENALKNVQAAEAAGVPVQEFVDTNTKLFQDLAHSLSVTFGAFQKGSDQKRHFPSSQELWKLCDKNGDIYKKSYEGLYCVGCETFYTPDELNDNGECFEHPGKKLETVKEENYFFKLSKYRDDLVRIVSGTHDTHHLEIVPEKRKNEVLSFLERGLNDISISRSNERAKNWGVPVPGDPAQRIYVWFDALNIYQSGIGFGWDEETYRKWWPADVHVIGKGITRFHAVYWPAFLLSAGLKLPKKLFVHEYFTVGGQKMSKTLGNVIDPIAEIAKYGTEAVRYYLLAKFSPFSDGDYSEDEFKKTYNSDLANGIGNLTARVLKLSKQAEGITFPEPPDFPSLRTTKDIAPYWLSMNQYRFNDALALIWALIKKTDKFLDTEEPWKKTGSEKSAIINTIIPDILNIAVLLQPFLPGTSEKILSRFVQNSTEPETPLFPRI